MYHGDANTMQYNTASGLVGCRFPFPPLSYPTCLSQALTQVISCQTTVAINIM